jgi:HEAT repeat protein
MPLFGRKDESPDERAVTIAALSSELQSPDEKVREKACKKLGKLRDPRALDPLLEALQTERDFVQLYASEALVDLGSAAVDPLISLLRHNESSVRMLAASALGSIGDKRAAGALEALISDPDAYVSEAARRSIQLLR